MPLYNIGDTVRAIRDHPDGNEDIVCGLTGVVAAVRDDDEDMRCVGVCWDEDISGGHKLRCKGVNSIDVSRGWWCLQKEIERIYETELEAPDLSDDDFMNLFCGT